MKRVLVLSGTASAINYINSLAADPAVSLHVTDSDPCCPGLYAPGVVPHRLPLARDTGAYRNALDELLRENAIDVLIPTSDYDVAGVMDYLRDGWAPAVAMFKPPIESFDLLSHKGRLIERISQRFPQVVPRTWPAEQSASGLPAPVVVKPTAESGGKGVSIVRQQVDLPPALQRIRGLVGNSFVIQEFIPGRTYIVSLVYDHAGSLVIGAGMRSYKTFFTWGGGGCAGEMVCDPRLLALTDAVVQACGGWRGPINVEWRRHAETGEFYLMEANCRLNGYSYLTTMNGVCLPRFVLALLIGEKLPLVSAQDQRTRNFNLGFRETLVSNWIG